MPTPPASLNSLSVGVDAPEKVAHIPEGKGLFSVVLRGQLLRLDDMASHPEAAGFCDGHPPMTSLLAVPLRVEGQIGGAFYVSEKTDGSSFTDSDQSALVAMAEQAAAAVHHLRALTEARQLAERNADLLSRLYHLAAALNGALAPSDVARTIVEGAIAALGADAGMVARLAEDGLHMDVLFNSEPPAGEQLGEERTFAVPAGTPLEHAVRTTPLIFGSLAEVQASGLTPSGPRQRGYAARALLPLLVEGRTVGILRLLFVGERDFTATERLFMMSVAEQCALALHRSNLWQAEQESRQDLEAAHRRLEQILDQIPFGVVVARAGSYELENASAQQIVGVATSGRTIPAMEGLGLSAFRPDGRRYEADELPVQRALRGEHRVGRNWSCAVRPAQNRSRCWGAVSHSANPMGRSMERSSYFRTSPRSSRPRSGGRPCSRR